MANSNILDQIESGQIARLIPTVADSKREERATSSLLAAFMVVPAFAQAVLSATGAPGWPAVHYHGLTQLVGDHRVENR